MFSTVSLLIYILVHTVNSFGYKTNDGTPVSLRGYPSDISGSTPPLGLWTDRFSDADGINTHANLKLSIIRMLKLQYLTSLIFLTLFINSRFPFARFNHSEEMDPRDHLTQKVFEFQISAFDFYFSGSVY
jgi:hypothetical protein